MDVFDMDKFKKLIRNYKVYASIFVVFFVFCITSSAWMPIFYKPIENVNADIQLYLQDVVYTVDTNQSKKISERTWLQGIKAVPRSEFSTMPVILVIQDEQVVDTFVIENTSLTEIELRFDILNNKENIQFYFYQPPPLVTMEFKETQDYNLLYDYHANIVEVDYRAYQ